MPKPKIEVITLGSGTIDVFVRAKSELITIRDPDACTTNLIAFPTGGKFLIDTLNFTVGGGGTNTAAVLNRLGHKVSWIGKVGNDLNATTVLAYLKEQGIDTSMVRKGSGNTGFSVILYTLNEDRVILTSKGENDNLLLTDIDFPMLEQAEWIYSTSMMNTSFLTQQSIFAHARSKGIRTMYNPSQYQAKQGVEHLRDILANTEILVLNLEEAQLLVGRNSMHNMLQSLAALGPKIVIITNGGQGINAYDSKYFYSAVPPKVSVIDTTGAGDAFGSGFLGSYIFGLEIPTCLRVGIASSTSVIQYFSSKDKLLTWNEAGAVIAEQDVKVSVETA